MRSWLYVPGNTPGMLLNAGVYGADGLVPDLEDSVPPDRKDEARILVREMLEKLDYGPARVVVRINGPESPWWQDDLATLVPLMKGGKITGIRLPKAENPESVLEVCGYLDYLEKREGLAPESIGLQCILETPAGVEQAFAVAAASSRTRALCFGAEDYCAASGIDRYGEGFALDYPRSRIVCAAAASGIPAYDSVWGAYRKPEGLEREALRSRSLGFGGKSVIHPSQVSQVNEIFSPTPGEIDWAESVLSAAEAVGGGCTGVNGMMVDKPVISRARRILERRLP